jgi:hypothetical protein
MTTFSGGISGIYQIHLLFIHRSCPSHHQLYPLLEYEHSEQYHINNLLLQNAATEPDNNQKNAKQ